MKCSVYRFKIGRRFVVDSNQLRGGQKSIPSRLTVDSTRLEGINTEHRKQGGAEYYPNISDTHEMLDDFEIHGSLADARSVVRLHSQSDPCKKVFRTDKTNKPNKKSTSNNLYY